MAEPLEKPWESKGTVAFSQGIKSPFNQTDLALSIQCLLTRFRHQILTYLTSKGIIDAKIQLISGHKNRDSLSIYQDLSLSDIEKEYWDAMKDFPIQ
jgi:hypothetical protein